MLPRFTPGQRVRVITGKPGTVIDPAVAGTAQGRPTGVRVQLDPWRADFGHGRPRRIQCCVICHPDDLMPL